MTQAQRFELLIDGRYRSGASHTSLWTKACTTQGWNRSDRAFRLQTLSRALGREITSTKELNNTDDVDRVFTFLRACADSIDAAREIDEPERGRARRLVFRIREVESELTAYPATNPMGPDGVRRLVRSLCADIANKGKSVRVEIVDVEDLSAAPITYTRAGKHRRIPSQLDQLLVTLTRMLSKYKEDAKSLEAQDYVNEMSADPW